MSDTDCDPLWACTGAVSSHLYVLHRRLAEQMRISTCTKQLKVGSSLSPTLMVFTPFRSPVHMFVSPLEACFCHSHEDESVEALVFQIFFFCSDG